MLERTFEQKKAMISLGCVFEAPNRERERERES